MLILLTLFYGWSCDHVSGIDGKSRLALPLLSEAICLPLNPGECGILQRGPTAPVGAGHDLAVEHRARGAGAGAVPQGGPAGGRHRARAPGRPALWLGAL